MNIRNFLNRFRRFRTEPRVGDRVIVNFLGSGMAEIQRSCTGTVTRRLRSYIERHFASQGGDKQTFSYKVKLDTGETVDTHSSWLHYDTELKMWTVRK